MSLGYWSDGWSPVEDEAAFERMVGGRWVSEDEREDARREEIDDARDYVTCSACGEAYDPERHPATRTEPAWVGIDACPSCGSSEWED